MFEWFYLPASNGAVFLFALYSDCNECIQTQKNEDFDKRIANLERRIERLQMER